MHVCAKVGLKCVRTDRCVCARRCLNMDVSFCTCVHACRCMCSWMSAKVFLHMCARVCLWVCAGVWIHVRVHVQGCVHVSACFFTRVCVHRGAPALPQKSFLGEAELTRDCWRAQGREVQLCSTARCTAACRTARSTAASGCWDAGMRHCTEHTLTHTVGQSERLSTAVHSY